jgi:hypothetical protein
MNSTTIGIPIPELLWTDLEGALQMHIKLLAKDIAKTLNQPATALLEKLQGGLLKCYTVPDTEDAELDARCCYVCPVPGSPAFMGPCGQPIAWAAKKLCPAHMFAKPQVVPAFQVSPLEHEERVLAVGEDGTVYDGYGDPCGTYCRTTGSMTLLQVE